MSSSRSGVLIDNYVKANSQNLPKVDLDMLLYHIETSFKSAETRGTKILRSMRENYGDEAIGYVQILRSNNTCTVQAEVCPEHKVHNKNYKVNVVIDEEEESILDAKCQDCAASEGGCKHAIALVAWLYRKSETVAPTSVSCYWNKPYLSEAISKFKYLTIEDMLKKTKNLNDDRLQVHNNDFFNAFIKETVAKTNNSHLMHLYNETELQKLTLHHRAIAYNGNKTSAKDFINYCSEFLNVDSCKYAEEVSKTQCKNPSWHELRYGRITASILHEAAQCKTIDGSLVEKIMSSKDFDTDAMRRGRQLEDVVLSVVNEHLKIAYHESSIVKCGLLLSKKYPTFGASPDGLTKQAVIEIKCPSEKKNLSRYYIGTKIGDKYKAQLHLQMLFAQKSYGYFCIADPQFEKNKNVYIIKESLDENFIIDKITRADQFWHKAVFPLLMKFS